MCHSALSPKLGLTDHSTRALAELRCPGCMWAILFPPKFSLTCCPQCWLRSCPRGFSTFLVMTLVVFIPQSFSQPPPPPPPIPPVSPSGPCRRDPPPSALGGGLTVRGLRSLGPLGKCIGLNLNPSSLSCACLCMINFPKMSEK